jgi:hypothetical protein
VDHVYAAIAAGSHPVRDPEHEVRWFSETDIVTAPDVSEDARVLAARLLAIAAPHPGPSFHWPPEPDGILPGVAAGTCHVRACPRREGP